MPGSPITIADHEYPAPGWETTSQRSRFQTNKKVSLLTYTNVGDEHYLGASDHRAK